MGLFWGGFDDYDYDKGGRGGRNVSILEEIFEGSTACGLVV